MLDLLTAAPKTVRFGDRKLKVGALKLKELGLLQRWIRDHSVRPTVAVKAILEFYDPTEHRQLLKQAVIDERSWPPTIGTAEGNRVLFDDLEGQEFFLSVMLRKYQKDLSDEALGEIMEGLNADDFGMLVSIAFGEDDLDPEDARRQAQLRRLAAVASLEPSTSESSSTPT